MASLNFYDITMTPFLGGLKNAHAFITKAYEHVQSQSLDADSYLTASLHPDMKGFIFQIQRFTDSAKAAPPRINPVIEPISLPDEEKTFPEVLARIEKTIKYLEGIDRKHFDGREGSEVKMPFGGKVNLEFTGLEYVMRFAHPNFWFHVTTAYDILRMKGVDLGKRDFLNAANLVNISQNA